VKRLGALLLFAGFGLFAVAVRGAEVLPPAPAAYFNDYASVVDAATAQRLNAELDQFERDTSTQLVVAIWPHLPSASSIEDYSTRVFEAWKVGRARLNNGAVLFIFTQDHRMRIQTGYGLEGALPDARCKEILEDLIAPKLRAGDFAGGVTAGVDAMMAAVRGEYRGTGRTAHDARGTGLGSNATQLIFLAFIVLMIVRGFFRRGVMYGGSGRRGIWLGGPWGGGGGGWSGGGGSSGGGFSGGFSGGGGSTGGGGASGSW